MADETLGGGRVEIVVDSDTTGFGAELRAKVNAAVAKVRAVVPATVDEKGMRRDLARAAREAQAATKIKVRTEVAADRLRTELGKAVREAQASQKIRVRTEVAADRLRVDLGKAVREAQARTQPARVNVNVDGRQVARELNRAVREARATADVELAVQAQTARAREEVERFRQSEERDPVEVPVVPDERRSRMAFGKLRGGSLTDVIGNLRVPAAAAGLNLLATGLASLAAGAVAVAGSLAPVVGVLGAIPGVAIAAAAGIGAVILASSGLGDAIKALTKEQRGGTAAAAAAVRTDRQREAAAERVADAQRRVADAVRNAAERQRQAARAVADAERSLANAQRAAKDAQEALNDARKEAAERLEDLRLEMSRAALDEEGAQLALEEALKRQEEVNRSVTATDLERRQAALAVKEAEQRLAEVQERNADLATEYADAQKKGVDGADNVVDAQERLAEAQEGVRDAVRDVAEAQRQAAITQQDSARDIADAQREVARAMRDMAEVGVGGANKVADAMEGLSPAARRFARVLVGYLPILDRLKESAAEALFPRLEVALERLVRLQPTAQRALGSTAAVIGDLAVEGATLVSSGPFARDLGAITERNTGVLRNFGRAGLVLIDALRHVTVAAGPLLDRLSKGALGLAEGVRDAAGAGRESGSLAKFFDVAADRGAQLLRIVRNIATGLFGVGSAGDDLGTDLLDGLERLTARFAEFANSVRGRGELAAYFEGARPVLEATGRLVADIFRGLAGAAASPELAPLIEQVRTQLLPAIGDLATQASSRLGPALVDLLTAFVTLKASIPFEPFLTMLNAVADLSLGIATLLRNVPGLGTLVGTFAALAATSKLIQFGGKVTGINAFVNALSGKGTGALSNFVRGVKGADGAADTFAGRLGKRVTPALKGVRAALGRAATQAQFMGRYAAASARGGIASLAGGLRSGATAAREFAVNAGRQAVAAAGRLAGAVRSGAQAAAQMAVSVGRATAAWVVNAAAQARATIATLAQRAASALATVATTVMTAAQAALNLVLSLNPIGLVVIAIVALVAAVVVAYKKVGWFRNLVNAAFGLIARVGKAAFGTVVNALRTVGRFLGAALVPVRAYYAVWFAVLGRIVSAVRSAWDWVVGKFRQGRTLLSGILGAVREAVVGAFRRIKDALVTLGTGMKNAILTPVESLVNLIKAPINGLLGAVRFVLRQIGKVKITLPKFPGIDIPGIPDGATIGLPDLSHLIPNLAAGATVLPTPGGTVVRVAEAGRAETIVDEGLVNRRLAEMEAAGPRVVFEAGAIVINNPAPEPAGTSLNARMRALEALGIFGGAPAPAPAGG